MTIKPMIVTTESDGGQSRTILSKYGASAATVKQVLLRVSEFGKLCNAIIVCSPSLFLSYV